MYLVEIGVKKNIGLNRPHNSYETLALKKIWRLVVVCFVFENNAALRGRFLRLFRSNSPRSSWIYLATAISDAAACGCVHLV